MAVLLALMAICAAAFLVVLLVICGAQQNKPQVVSAKWRYHNGGGK